MDADGVVVFIFMRQEDEMMEFMVCSDGVGFVSGIPCAGTGLTFTASLEDAWRTESLIVAMRVRSRIRDEMKSRAHVAVDVECDDDFDALSDSASSASWMWYLKGLGFFSANGRTGARFDENIECGTRFIYQSMHHSFSSLDILCRVHRIHHDLSECMKLVAVM